MASGFLLRSSRSQGAIRRPRFAAVRSYPEPQQGYFLRSKRVKTASIPSPSAPELEPVSAAISHPESPKVAFGLLCPLSANLKSAVGNSVTPPSVEIEEPAEESAPEKKVTVAKPGDQEGRV